MTDLAWTRERLAELCGVQLWSEGGPGYLVGPPYAAQVWEPWHNISQAMQCLAALQDKSWRWAIEWWLSYDIQLQPPTGEKWVRQCHETHVPLEQAIVMTICEALGWQKTGEPAGGG